MSSMPTRIERDLFDAAKKAGRINSRSAAQQLDHWARVGRELEASPKVTLDTVERVLTGQQPYDAADDRAQAVVRAAWDEELTSRIANLDLTEELRASGLQWAEAGDDGAVVVRGPGVSSA